MRDILEKYIEKSKEVEELGKEKVDKIIELDDISPQLEEEMMEVCERLDFDYNSVGVNLGGDFELTLNEDIIDVEDFKKLEKEIGLPVKRISIVFKVE